MGRRCSRYRQCERIKQAKLNQHRSLVPVDMLVRQLIPFKLDNGYCRDFHHAPCRCNSRQHPIDLRSMRKADDEFVYDGVPTNGTANRRQTEVGWVDRDEMVGIEAL